VAQAAAAEGVLGPAEVERRLTLLERALARPGAASIGTADPPPVAWLDQIESDLEGALAALRWLGEHGDPGGATYLAHGTLRFWSNPARRLAIVAQRVQQHASLRRGVAAARERDYRAGQLLCEASRAVVAALGARQRQSNGSGARRAANHGALTPREWEVATLVAEGLTNREIAERLVITERTASTHMVHILTKLGFHSRAQIAAWVAPQRRG
jgi:DNA-binding CsgD family transcriptional regulator